MKSVLFHQTIWVNLAAQTENQSDLSEIPVEVEHPKKVEGHYCTYRSCQS